MMLEIINRMAVVLLLSLAVLVGAWWYVGGQDPLPRELVFSGGELGGRYLSIARAIAESLEREIPNLTVTVLTSEGSNDNLRRLTTTNRQEKADLTLVQNDAVAGDAARSLALVYEEYLDFMALKDPPIHQLKDLKSRRVAVGPLGSGTRRLVENLLRHHGMSFDDFDARSSSSMDAARLLVDGQIDAMFCVSGVRHPACQLALRSDNVGLVTLGAPGNYIGNPMAGFRTSYPFVRPYLLPKNVYTSKESGAWGKPEEPVITVAVPALLVCHRDLPRDLARKITHILFSNRASLVQREAALSELAELSAVEGLQFPIHPGADDYYHRTDPGFLLTYAESMGFMLSAALAMWGVAAGFAGWIKRKKKNRMDVYFIAIERIMENLTDTKEKNETFHAHSKELLRLRHQAVTDMVNERLLADESFRIFQTMLADCQNLIERRLDRLPARSVSPESSPKAPGRSPDQIGDA